MNKYLNKFFIDKCVELFLNDDLDNELCRRFASEGAGSALYSLSSKYLIAAHRNKILDRLPTSSEGILIAARLIEHYSARPESISEREVGAAIFMKMKGDAS